MKSLKMVVIALAAFVVVGIAGCTKPPLKVPDVSILRVDVQRVSTSNRDVLEHTCRWFIYAINGYITQKSLRDCMSGGGRRIPISLMKWKVPVTRDTDRCTLTDKSTKCKKIVKIFFMRVVFVQGQLLLPSQSLKKDFIGNITSSNKILKERIIHIKYFVKHKYPGISISVKATTEWLNRMNRLAKENPPKQPS